MFTESTSKYFKGFEKFRLLDLTFGSGENASSILASNPNVFVTAICNSEESFEIANELHEKEFKYRLTPLRVDSFTEVPNLVRWNPFFDGLLVDWFERYHPYDPEEYEINLTKKGRQSSFSISDALSHLEEKSLHRLFRDYGGMNLMTKYAVNSIIEGRYCFNTFETKDELLAVMSNGANQLSYHRQQVGDAWATELYENPEVLAIEMTNRTIVAMRSFINDDLNEFSYAVKTLGENLLIPGEGIAIIITQLKPEWSVLQQNHHKIENDPGVYLEQDDIKQLTENPKWKSLISESVGQSGFSVSRLNRT